MKKPLFLVLFLAFVFTAKASEKDSTIYYNLPDSVKAVQFITDVTIRAYDTRKSFSLQLRTEGPSLTMETGKKSGSFIFYSNAELKNIRIGINTHTELKAFGIVFPYKWELNETYKLLIAQATDSAAAITIYSGYVFLPREGKWKFIGSGTVASWQPSLRKPTLVLHQGKKQEVRFTHEHTWVQRSSGSWKNLKGDSLPPPTINLFGHLDSAQQRSIDSHRMSEFIKGYHNKEGVLYSIIREGTGREVAVTDTVSVYYRVTRLNDTTTIDEAKDKPARFPLNRLIRGWQIGVPLLKVGGKIRLIIPSDLAYSIRTRSAKIPPNSILDFIIEVVDAIPQTKPPNP